MFPQCFRCLILLLWFSLGAVLFLVSAAAQPAQQAPTSADAPATPAPGGEEATLVVQNRPITVFRARLLGRSPAERAASATRRIDEVIEAKKGGDVTASPIPQGVLISVAETGAFMIAPADLDLIAGESLEAASEHAVRNLTVALGEAMEQRDARRLLQAVGLTGLGTAFFLLAVWSISRAHRYLLRRLPEAAGSRLKSVSFSGFTVLGADRLLLLARWLISVAAWAIGLLAAYLWLTYSLERFPYTRPWGEALGAYLLSTIKSLLLGAIGAMPGLLTAILIFLFVRFLARTVKAFFDAVEAGAVSLPWVHAETAQPTRRVVVVLLWLFALIVAYPYIPGSHSEAFKAVSVFVGVVVSLSSSGLIGQAMSGLVLMYSRAFKPGEYVHINETEGVVTSVGMFSTKIETHKREEVTIPNSVVLGTTTKNFSRLAGSEGVILYTTVTIGYSAPWRQVHALLLLAADRAPGLRKEPPPYVAQTALSDFYVTYQLNAHLERPEERPHVLAALHANIQDVFNEHGVQIMSPHYVGDPPQPVWVPRENWYAAPARRRAEAGDGATSAPEHQQGAPAVME